MFFQKKQKTGFQMNKAAYDATFSPFRGFTRDEWSKLEEHPMFPVSDID